MDRSARAKSHDGSIPGNLIAYQGQVVSQGVDFLEAFYQLEPLEKRIAEALDKNANDAWALAHRGEIELDAGKLDDALADIRRSYKLEADSFTRELLIDTLTTALAQDFATHRDAVGELENLVQLDSQRAAFYRVLATGLQKTGDKLGAINTYLKLASLEAPEDLEVVEPGLSVARDRWVRGQFSALLGEVNPDDRRKIDAAVEEQLSAALAQKGAKPLERFLNYFGDHPLADRAREELFDQINDSSSYLAREQLLRQLEQSGDAEHRKSARAQLAMLLHAAGRDDEARRYYAQLRKEFGDQPVLGGKSVSQLLSGMPADSPLRADAAKTIWPEGEIKVERSDVRPQRMQFLGIKLGLDLRGRRDPIFQDATVEYDQSRGELVVQDGLGQERVRTSLAENGRAPNIFVSPSPSTHYATTYGHMMLACMGDRVYAIDALTPANTPNRLLWSQMLSDPANNPYTFGTQISTKAMLWGANKTVIKVQNQLLGNAGPCTANGVCIQQGRQLSCFDLITGKPQWVRRNIAPGAEIFGDEDITIVAPAPAESQNDEPPAIEAMVLRTIDGQLLGKCDVPPPKQSWATLGRCVLVWHSAANGKLEVKLTDPWAKRDLWSASFAPGSKGTIVESESAAIMQPDGKFTMLDLADGHKTIDDKLEAEPSLQRIFVLRSKGQDILVTDHPFVPDRPPNKSFMPPQGANEWACRLVTGRLYAFDRATGKQRWPAPAAVEQHGLLLNSPAELPVIVFLRMVQPNPGTAHGSVLCIDKCSGRMVYEFDELPQMMANYDLSGDAKEKSVTITTPPQSITLNYTDAPIPPEPPYQAGLFDRPKGTLETGKAGALFNALRNSIQIVPNVPSGSN